jgi:regulatory protein YycH of two-component signal transduction system YycFG
LAFRCRESTVNSSPKGVEKISIFTDFPQSDSIEIFTKCLKIHTDQPEYKNLDYLLIEHEKINKMSKQNYRSLISKIYGSHGLAAR